MQMRSEDMAVVIGRSSSEVGRGFLWACSVFNGITLVLCCGGRVLYSSAALY